MCLCTNYVCACECYLLCVCVNHTNYVFLNVTKYVCACEGVGRSLAHGQGRHRKYGTNYVRMLRSITYACSGTNCYYLRTYAQILVITNYVRMLRYPGVASLSDAAPSQVLDAASRADRAGIEDIARVLKKMMRICISPPPPVPSPHARYRKMRSPPPPGEEGTT